jgi:heme/copper-type cytochrome/quinol oxidase subunit 2
VESAWTVIPILIVIALALATARVIASVQDAPRPPGAETELPKGASGQGIEASAQEAFLAGADRAVRHVIARSNKDKLARLVLFEKCP